MESLKTFFMFSVVVVSVLLITTLSFAQLENARGVRLKDGSVIYGKVVKMVPPEILIETDDGVTIARKFDDVESFIKEGDEDWRAPARRSTALVQKGQGPYMSFNMGIAMPKDSDATDPDWIAAGVPMITFDADTGFALGAAIGYAFNQYARLEAELAYQKNDLDKAGVPGVSIDVSGDVEIFSIMANGYIDFANDTALTPFISAGLGFARVDVSRITTPLAPGVWLNGGRDTVFAYNLGAGVGFAVTEQVTIDFKYRYFATEDPKIVNTEIDVGSHNLYAGIRYSF